MIDNQLADGCSPIHDLDPKVRILGGSLLSVAAALCDTPLFSTAYLLIAVLLVLLARLPLKPVWKRLKPLVLFLVMIWIFLPLTFEGRIIYEYHFLAVSLDGIRLSINISLKSLAILLIFTALLATMPVTALGHGLQQLRIPDKLVFLLLMSYRYISVIEEEYNRLLRAARFRGFTPGTNLHSYRTYAYLAGMLFVRAAFRAGRVYQAMQCRGFKGIFYTLDVYPPTRLNTLFLTAITGVALLLTATERLPGLI